MQKHVHELLEILADGGLDAEDLAALSREVGKAESDAAAYLASDTASGYPAFQAQHGAAAMPLWQWVLLEQLEGGLVFRGASAAELYGEISAAFGEDELDLTIETLAGLDDATALARIEAELAPAYTLVDFAQRIDARRQTALVRSTKLERFVELVRELGLAASITR